MNITVSRKVTLAIILVATVIALGADDDETSKNSVRSHITESDRVIHDVSVDEIDVKNSDENYDIKIGEKLDDDSIVQISDESLDSDKKYIENDKNHNCSSSINDDDIHSSKCQNESKANNEHNVRDVNTGSDVRDTQITRQPMESLEKDESNELESSQNNIIKQSLDDSQQNIIHDKDSHLTDMEVTTGDDNSESQNDKGSTSQISDETVEQINIIAEDNTGNPIPKPIESKIDDEKDLNKHENPNKNQNNIIDSLNNIPEEIIQSKSIDTPNQKEIIKQIQKDISKKQNNAQNKSKQDDDDEEDDVPIKHRVVVNYAHKSAGAVVLEKSSNFKGTSNLLTSDNDKYAISPCDDKKYVVIGLSEDILVKQIMLANFERYSSHIQNFQILGSQAYPTGNWHDLGIYTAQPGNGVQMFDLMEPSWARYLKFKFISHYGEEHFCTVSQIKVHGSTMLQGFHEQWTQSEKEEKQMLQEEEVQTKETHQKHEQIETHTQGDITLESDEHSSPIYNNESHSTSETFDESLSDINETRGDLHVQESINTDEIDSKVDKNSNSNDFVNTDNNEKTSENTIPTESESGNDIPNDVKVANKDDQIHTEKTKEDTPKSIYNESHTQHIPKQDDLAKETLNNLNVKDEDVQSEKKKEQEVITTESTLKSSKTEETTIPQSVSEDEINKDDTHKSDLPDLYYSKIADAVFKIKAGTITVSDAVKKITEGSSVSYDTVRKLSSMIKVKIMNQLEESNHDETIHQMELENQKLEPKQESNAMEESTIREKMEQPIRPTSNSATTIQVNNEDILPTHTKNDLNTDASISKEHNNNDVIVNDKDIIDNTNKLSKSNSQKEKQNIPLQSNPLPNVKVNNMDITNSGVSSSIPSSGTIPSISCMDGISNFHEYKAKITAQRSAKLNSLSGSGNGGNSASIKMEPIFKTLTDEIKALQSTQTIYDQYLNSVVACYQKVMIEMSLEMTRLENNQNERIDVLEKALKSLTDEQTMRQNSFQHPTNIFSSSSSITLAAIATSSMKYFSLYVKPFIKTILNFLIKQFIFCIKEGLKFLNKQEWFPQFNETSVFNTLASQLDDFEMSDSNLIALFVFVFIWRIIRRRRQSNENQQK